MRTEHNDLQKAVDRRLSQLSWGEKQRRSVMIQLQKEEKPMKRKLSMSFALVLAAMLLAVGALAATSLMRSPEADAVTQARQAVMERYGLTVETLGIFHATYESTADGWRVAFRPSMDINANMDEAVIGVYTVEKTADGLAVTWSHDDADPASYAGGNLTDPVWAQEQLRKVLHEGRAEISALAQQRSAATPQPVPEEEVAGASVWMNGTIVTTPENGDMPMAEAKEIMRAAVQAELALTDAQAAQIGTPADYDEAAVQFVQDAGGVRMWEFQVDIDVDGSHYSCGVFINAQTGEVVRISYTVLGNG